ncbi:hypothetical protein N8743_02050 [Candidatus Pelagibacter ubique]|nr:hypothetical protein [Candidatus Pelagibacter ubique]
MLNFFLFYTYSIFAKKWSFLDNSRKFNNPITVTSAGIIIYLNFLIIFTLNFIFEFDLIKNLPNNYFLTFTGLTILVVMSAIDDFKSIDPRIRLFFQLICIYFSLSSIPLYQLGLPLKLAILIFLFIWIYLINITNFTDGSDGFLVINTIFVFLNFILLDHLLKLNSFSKDILVLILPSILVFLYFNKPSAKLYLGDSGSILIGFINGFLFLTLLTINYINLALSLLIYPIMDCSIALAKKSLQGKLPWADTSNYSFLQPTIKNNGNKLFVFYFNLFFNLLNSVFIFIQIMFGWYYIFLNIIFALITIKIYEKKD